MLGTAAPGMKPKKAASNRVMEEEMLYVSGGQLLFFTQPNKSWYSILFAVASQKWQ